MFVKVVLLSGDVDVEFIIILIIIIFFVIVIVVGT